MRNTRRYGGYIVHFGMVLVFIGIAGTPFNKDIQKDLGIGDTLKIGPYTILCQNFDQVNNDNYQSDRATLEVFKSGKSEMMLYPERRFFLASQVTETMVAVQSSPLHDLYVVYAGRSPESGRPVDPRLFVAAGEMDLVRRHRGGTRDNSCADSKSATALVLRPVTERSWTDSIADDFQQWARSPAGQRDMINCPQLFTASKSLRALESRSLCPLW